MTLRILRRDKMNRGTHHPLLALDIENDSKTGAFICAGLFGKIGERAGHNHDKREIDIIQYFDNLPALHDFLLTLNKSSCRLVFYNLSYDIVYLRDIIAAPELDKNGLIRNPVLQVGTRIITAKLKNGLKCLDLFNHTCEGSLGEWGEYCKFTVKKQDLTDLKRRVMTDAELTFRLGEFIEAFYYNEYEIPLQLTVGASALKIFVTKYFTDYWKRDNEELSKFEREAYYGGRTEIFKKGNIHSYSYDINSTYLSIMRDCELPDVSSVRFRNNADSVIADLGIDYKKHLAIIDCLVRTPENQLIGVLPVRVNNKLTFPIGQFRGVWCNIELIAAIKAGYKIERIYKYVFYNHSRKYFHEFALSIWEKRLKYRAAGNAGMDKLIKRVGNSLYGKFGERHETQLDCKLSEIDFELPDGCEIYNYLGVDYVRFHSEKTPSEHEFPCIPAFITAYARVKLLDGMLANAKSLIYVDTDSIKLTHPAKNIVIGNELGEWKNEGEHKTIFYRCKFYGDKHKGVPKNAEIVEKTDKFIKYKFTKPTREREAMRRNLVPNVWLEQFKTLLFDDDKRLWIKNKSKPNILYYDYDVNKILTIPEIEYNIGGDMSKKSSGDVAQREKMREVRSYQAKRQNADFAYSPTPENTEDYKAMVRESDAARIAAYEAEQENEAREIAELDMKIAEAGEQLEDYTITRKRKILKAQKAHDSSIGDAALLLIAGVALYKILKR